MAAITLRLSLFLALLGSAKAASLNNFLLDLDKENGEMCQDCAKIIQLMKDLTTDQDFRDKISNTLELVCEKLPAQFTQICQDKIEKLLPLAITFITSMIKPNNICKSLGLCKELDGDRMIHPFLNHLSKTSTNTNTKDSNTEGIIKCYFCRFIMKMVTFLIPKDKTESIVTTLLETLCREFPAVVQPQCNKMIEKYVQLLLDMLLNNSSPNFICNLLQLCTALNWKPGAPALSDCESCLTLSILTRMDLGSNVSESRTTSFLSSVCQLHPNAIPKCESFVQLHGNKLRVILGKELPMLETCMSANLCEAEDGEPVFADPCSLGPSYSCQDLQTAVDCDVVSFCQKNVWM